MTLLPRIECRRPIDREIARVQRERMGDVNLRPSLISREALAADRVTTAPVRLAHSDATHPLLSGVQPVRPSLYRTERKHAADFPIHNYTGPLFRGAAKPTDVLQNQLGDCDEQAAARALAAAQPTLVRQLVRAVPKQPGVAEIRFANGDAVPIDGHFASQKKDVVLYGGGPGVQAPKTMLTWNAKLEAGTAAELSKLSGKPASYDALGDGGDPGDILKLWVGGKIQDLTTKRASTDSLWAAISAAVKKHDPETLTTYDDKTFKYKGTGIIGDHTNAITSVKVENGTRYVQIQNPWGEHEPGFDPVKGKSQAPNDGKNDGIFWLSIEDVKKYYEGVQIDHLTGKLRLANKPTA